MNSFALLVNLLSLMLALGFLLDLFHGTTQSCPPKTKKFNENYSIFVTALKCLQKQKEKSVSWEGLLQLVILLHVTLPKSFCNICLAQLLHVSKKQTLKEQP